MEIWGGKGTLVKETYSRKIWERQQMVETQGSKRSLWDYHVEWNCEKVGEVRKRNYNKPRGWFIDFFWARCVAGRATVEYTIPEALQISTEQKRMSFVLLALKGGGERGGHWAIPLTRNL